MMLLLLFLLLLEELIVIPVSVEGAVYYVKPTDPLSSNCPNETCHTLDYYFSNADKYFNSSEVNVTLILLNGSHLLKTNNNGNVSIHDLEVFKMTGMEPASDVNVNWLCHEILLVNIENIYIRMVTFTNTFITLSKSISGVFIDNVYFTGKSTLSVLSMVSGFNMVLTNSSFLNQSVFHLDSRGVNGVTPQWKINQCTFQAFYLDCHNTQITIEDSTFTGSNDGENSSHIHTYHSTVVFVGRVLISSGSIDSGGLSYVFYLFSSNVTIAGTVMFANSTCSPMISYSSAITLSGNVSFLNNAGSLLLYSSTITLVGNISFVNNTGTNGGAMALYSSTLNIANNTNVQFYNNKAIGAGGAIYVDNGISDIIISSQITPLFTPCFYQLLDYSENNWYRIKFENNSAGNGGDHIYGEYMHSDICYVKHYGADHKTYAISSYHVQKHFEYIPESLSKISSNPTRVCLCDDADQPQCDDLDKTELQMTVHSGETFTLSVVVVGADLGTTPGSVHAIFESPRNIATLKPASQFVQPVINIRNCSKLNYTIFSQRANEEMHLTIADLSLEAVKSNLCSDYVCRANHGMLYSELDNKTSLSLVLLKTPLVLNISLLPCPLGFTLLGDPPSCYCHPLLSKVVSDEISCKIINGSGYLFWSGSMWLGVLGSEYFIAQSCPFNYCPSREKLVNVQSQNDSGSHVLCLSNREGTLCGQCKENHSLAIGSSRCIPCSTNNHLALFVFFAAAGFLLVVVISILNLTVTQGRINGFIFYANIIWIYKNILFPQVDANYFFAFLRVLVAWLNLDFGIQVCFVEGLNAFWRTWLQYVFPFYIWSIAGLIILGARHSVILTKLLGDRAVSILATLILLSYTKLLKVIVECVVFSPILVVNISTNYTYTITVWSLDGSYHYCHWPHVLLFVAALFVLTFLWIPYTLLLFLMQWLRKRSNLKPLQWIPRFKPILDAYFAPLKDKHHYWFGLLLIVRGLVFTSTYIFPPKINYILLLMIAAPLLCYANYHRVYRSKAVQLNENLFLVLILVLAGVASVPEEQARYAIGYASVIIAILGFLGIHCGDKIMSYWKQKKTLECVNEQRTPQQELSASSQFRDPIIDSLSMHVATY